MMNRDRLSRMMMRMLLMPLAFVAVRVVAQSYPMTVSPSVPVPPPYTYAELADIVGTTTVVITNSGPTQEVRARVRLRNQVAGITITTNEGATLGQCLEVPNGGGTWTLDELGEAFGGGAGFTSSLFFFEGITYDQIREDQLLPGPSWELCVQLIDCLTDEEYSAPFPAGCVTFIVPENQPPILTDICNSTFLLPDGLLQVNWSYMPPPGFEYEVDYRLRIVRIDPFDGREGDANDAILSATEPMLYEVEHDESPAMIEIPDELMLDPGFRYAVRVTAFSPDGYLPVQNEGHSAVCSFLYAPEGIAGTGVLRALWPGNDDWVPFEYVNVVTMFEPYRAYTRFDYTTTMRRISGSSLPDYSRTLNWPDGPEGTQELVTFSGLTVPESQCLSVYHPSLPLNTFLRGQRYRWRTVGDFTLGSSTTHGDTGEEPFGVGMGPSQPQEPANGSIVPAGNVTLRWLTANTPSEPLPPFDVVQAIGSTGPTFITGNLSEHWQLEVSRQSDFSTIFHSTHGSLTGEAWTLNTAIASRDAFLADIYKDLDNTASYTEEGTYYWRLHWKTDPTDITSTNYNTSATYTFCVGHCDDVAPPPAEPSGDCVSVCLEPEPTNTTAVGGLVVGATVRVGKFNMEVITVSGTGTTFSGNGKVTVPFLNDAKIMVEYTGLKVNSDGRMVDGDVEGRHDWNPPSLTMITDAAHQIPSMSEADLEAMNGFIQDGARLASLLSSGSEVGLPIGIDQEVDGRQIVCGIINMKFDVNRAYLDMVAGVDVPEIHTTLAFGVGDFCFTPTGLGDEGRAYLPSDITVTGDLSTSFRFRGGASTELANLTYVDWDCHGFKCLQVAAAVEFDRGTLLPDGDTDPAGTEKVEARFKFQVCREAHGSGTTATESWNVLAQFTMDPFEVPAAPDWLFTIEEAWLDWSTVSNPTGIEFPEGYDNPALNSEETADTWKGFFLKRLAMRTPEVLGDGTGEPFGGSVNNFIIDDGGLSFNFSLENILTINRGRIDSWAFSIDSIYMDMRENTFQRAGLAGQIGLPINGEHEFLNYGAILGFDDHADEFAFILEVELDDTLTAPMWIAELQLYPNSYVRATLGNESKVRAELNGKIGISTSFASELGLGEEAGGLPSINMPGMEFEDLVLDSDDGISCGDCDFATGFASPQKEVGGFPLSIRQLSLDLSNPEFPGLVVEPMVSLSGGEGESSFAASVALKFVVHVQVNSSGLERFDFHEVQFTGMHLDVDVSAVRLVGDLRITKTATKEEVKGALTVGFPMGIRGDLQACFGTIRLNTEVPINSSAQHYNYWMVDGMLYFNPGLMIMSGVGIYGFGGGAYHHMRFIDGSLPTNERLASMAPQAPPDTIPPADANAGDDHPDDFTNDLSADASTVGSSSAPSGGRYEEDFNTFLGIKLALVFGTYPKPDGCNMDLTLRGEFTSSGGLALLEVRGDIYALVDIPERDQARITGTILFSYANREGNEVVHANLAVMLDFGIARGAGDGNKLVDAVFHTESVTGQWYFTMGTPDNRGGLVIGPRDRRPILGITNYIMVGNCNIPATLPDPPARVMEILGLSDPSRGLGTEAETAAAVGGTREDMEELADGAGFAFGLAMELDIPPINLAVLYASFGMAIGFDMLLREYDASVICRETGAIPGDNGWFAQGQIYAGLWGELGVQLDLLFVQFRAPILSVSAAMLLEGNFPKPSGFRGTAAVHFSVLNGAITGDATLEVRDGSPCTLMSAGDPLQDFQFIQDLGPKGLTVSIFDLPTASYNIPVQEVLEVPEYIDPNTHQVVMYRFHPYVSSFTLKEMLTNTNIPGTNRFADERGTSSYLARVDAMKANTLHQTRVEVRVRKETAPGVLVEFQNPETGAVWSESRTQNFRTGAAPDHIPESNVDYTYPVNRQRYFMQQESNNKGRVRLSMGFPALFARTIEGSTYDYVARFIPLGGGPSVSTPIVYAGGYDINLTVPTLAPEQIYVVQLLRQRITSSSGAPMINVNISGGVGSSAAVTQAQQAIINANPLNGAFIAANGDEQRLNLTGGNVQRAVSLMPNDHLLYTFRFKTSKYNTLLEKFASLTLDGKTPARYDDYRNADARGNATEQFDEFDIGGYWKGDTRKLGPLVIFGPDWNDSYYGYLQSTMYSVYSQYRGRRRYDFPGNSVDLPMFPTAHYILWGSQQPEPIVSYNGFIESPISDDEAEEAAAPPGSGPGGLPMINGGTPLTQGVGNMSPGAGMLGGSGGFSGLVVPSGILAGAMGAPWPSFGFLYRAGKHASTDQTTIRMAAFNALNKAGNNGSNLNLLLQANGPALNLGNMRYGVQQPYAAAALLRTDNLPEPTQEFPVYYNATYHVKMYYRSPITGSRNTISSKPFTLHYEEPPAYNGGTVLY